MTFSGITDFFRKHGPASISVFGPSQAAARMEGSKVFSKDFMKRHSIPTAAYETFSDHEEAQAYVHKNKDMRIVIKADGLAAGKGVIMPRNYSEASQALKDIMVDKEFGDAGTQVVIEEFLEGEELSVLSFSDGYTIRSLPAAQDHKRALDGDLGLNTGGMGCYAPTPMATQALMLQLHGETLQPTIDGMRKERMPFVGCLFTGFMITRSGPKVLEYNVRFGDPETQTLLPLLDSDLAEIMIACTSGYLSSLDLKIKPSFSTTVVVAAGGYPEKYNRGDPIMIGKVPQDTFVFHAGTIRDHEKELKTAGGRVICSTAIGSSIVSAVEKAYNGVSSIRFNRMHYRKDIAHRALKHMNGDDKNDVSADLQAMTYAAAGVSITAGDELVHRIKPFVKKTAQRWAPADIGGFGGEISLADAGYPSNSPKIVAAIDGIGTKLMVAQAIGEYSTVGIDLVAMNVNDLIVQGAKPLAFLDYYACGKLDVDDCVSFVKGVVEGCRQSQCALIGGETAEMPTLYKVGDFDAAGCAIGALGQDKPMLPAKDAMEEGDVLLGIASSGCHSNGFSLIRRIVERAGLAYTDPAPWEPAEGAEKRRSVGQSLLEPTKLYVKSLSALLETVDEPSIKGMAHITGGGLIGKDDILHMLCTVIDSFPENIPRAIPQHLSASVDVSAYPVPLVFQWLKSHGALDHAEFARTFNTGLGMVCVVAEEQAEHVKSHLESNGEKVFRVGKLIARGKAAGSDDNGCILTGLEAWDRW